MNKEFVEFLCQFANTREKQDEIRSRLSGKDKMQPVIDAIDEKCEDLEWKMDRMMELIQATGMHQKAFGEYRGCFADREVVLLGTGPTLAKYKPIPGAVHIGVNQAFKRDDIAVDFLFIQDTRSLNHDLHEANAYAPGKCVKFYGVQTYNIPDEFAAMRVHPSDATAAGAREFIVENYYDGPFAIDISRMPMMEWGSVMFSALQFALFTFPKKIYLVGVDCSNKGFFANDKHYMSQTGNTWLGEKWEKLISFFTFFYPSVKVVSINPVGLAGMFDEDIYQ